MCSKTRHNTLRILHMCMHVCAWKTDGISRALMYTWYMHKMCALWAHVLAKYVHAKLLCIVCITILSQEQWYKFHKHARILRSDLYHDTDDNATSLPILKAGLSNFHIVSCIQYILGIGINLLYTHTGIYLRISNGNWYKTHLKLTLQELDN